MNKKLRNSRGETLVEVLASVLVCALSITLLVGAVTVSASIDLQAQEADAEYYAALSEAEKQMVPKDPAGALLTVTNNQTGASKKISAGGAGQLHFYGFYDKERLLSYSMTGGGG